AWAVGSARADGPTIGPSAQAAYGVAVTFSLPPHLSATGLHVTLPQAVSSGLHVTPPHAAASDWTCDVRRVTCTGTLPSGASRTVAVTGRLPAAAPNLTTTRTPAPAD